MTKNRPTADQIGVRIANTMSSSVDVMNRHLYLIGEIDEQAAYRFITAFRTLDSTQGPILVTLCTPGGSVDFGFAIYDVIRMSNNIVVMEGIGTVMSMGSVILQAADARVLSPTCRFMIHNGSMDVQDHSFSIDQLKAASGEYEAMVGRMHRVLADRSKKNIEEIKALCAKETFLSAEDTCKYGFADKVLDFREQNAQIEIQTQEEEPVEKKPAPRRKPKKKLRA